MNRPPVVVLTPARNEAHILSAFIESTLSFADWIVMAVQTSVDETLEIAKANPRVAVIENASSEYSEKQRAEALVAKARELIGSNCFLLALDADEFIVSDGNASAEWEVIASQSPGTIVEFENIDALPGGSTMLRHSSSHKAFGFVDDGSDFEASFIHTQRVPAPVGSKRLRSSGLRVLHMNLNRPAANRAKRRYYCILETANRSNPWHRRLCAYSRENDGIGGGSVLPIPPSWLEHFSKLTPNPLHLDDSCPFWHDFQALALLEKHGSKRFWLEDIWDQDWAVLQSSPLRNLGASQAPRPIAPPPLVVRLIVRVAKEAFSLVRFIKGRLRLASVKW